MADSDCASVVARLDALAPPAPHPDKWPPELQRAVLDARRRGFAFTTLMDVLRDEGYEVSDTMLRRWVHRRVRE